MNENPTNGKSSPEKPAGFNWRVEDKTREFFSASSKFEVSSSDLRVGTKGGGAGEKKQEEKTKFSYSSLCNSPTHSVLATALQLLLLILLTQAD